MNAAAPTVVLQLDYVDSGEGVDTGGDPHQHLAMPEGEDGNTVWLPSVSPVKVLWFEDGHNTRHSQDLVHCVIKGSMVWQVSMI